MVDQQHTKYFERIMRSSKQQSSQKSYHQWTYVAATGIIDSVMPLSWPYADLFSFHEYGKNFRSRKPAHAREQYLWTRCQSVVPNDVPRDFCPVIAFWPGGGGYSKNFWVWMCRKEPLAYNRASFSWILLPYTRVNSWFPWSSQPTGQFREKW